MLFSPLWVQDALLKLVAATKESNARLKKAAEEASQLASSALSKVGFLISLPVVREPCRCNEFIKALQY